MRPSKVQNEWRERECRKPIYRPALAALFPALDLIGLEMEEWEC